MHLSSIKFIYFLKIIEVKNYKNNDLYYLSVVSSSLFCFSMIYLFYYYNALPFF